ncbi:MAG TPA: HNH endonuclease signature motif containing protein [Vicinamibacteria bacterium]|nr:HNH endonuclease signature motif containing protein [Vicinamibacteria bacterium]
MPAIPTQLTDVQLIEELTRCVGIERQASAVLVAHLAEMDARGLHFGLGFPSLYAYCCEVLHLAEGAAYKRIEVARAGRRYPVLLDRLADGSLNLSTARLLAPHLTEENHRDLIASASGLSKRAVEDLLAQRFPHAEVIPLRPVVTAVGDGRYLVRFVMTASALKKLRAAQDLLRHAVPSGDVGEIFERALATLIEERARKKFAAVKAPGRVHRGSDNGSRHVAAEVKRAVWLRDMGQCAFVSKSGRRCQERGFLEFHHIKPFALGGESIVENIELRCRAHNVYEATVFFGRGSSDPGASGSPPMAASQTDLRASQVTALETVIGAPDGVTFAT